MNRLRLRPIAVLIIGALVLLAIPTSFVVAGKVAAAEQARTEAAAADALEQKFVDYYRGALERLQPFATQIVHDAMSWSRSGSALLSEIDVSSLQSTASAVSSVMHASLSPDATSAELEAAFDTRWAVIQGGRERMDGFAATVIEAANARLAAAPLADSASRQALTEAIAAIEAAVANREAIALLLTGVTSGVEAVSASQAAAEAAAAAAAAARRGGGPAVTCGSNIATYVGEVLSLVNQERANEGLAPLSSNNSLNAQAQAHATCMAVNNTFAHSSRVRGFGNWGENIAKGYPSASSVVSAWMGSPGHRANILNPNFSYMGLGYVADGNWWCQNFGG